MYSVNEGIKQRTSGGHGFSLGNNMIEIIYCTCNTHLPEIDELCRKYLKGVKYPIISVSLNKEIDFGDKRIVMHGKRGPLMLYEQMTAGLEASNADYILLSIIPHTLTSYLKKMMFIISMLMCGR